MSHLSLETIARLVDEQPSALDNAHLDACDACRAALDAMRADVDALAALPDMMPPAASWDAVSARLRAEGLMQASVIPLRRRTTVRLMAQAAGIAIVFLGGALAGRALRDDPPPAATRVADAPAPANTRQPQATASGPVAEPLTTPAGSSRNVQLASEDRTIGNAALDEGPVSEDEALRRLRDAEDTYFNALSSYSQAAGTATSDPTTRLAALEAIVITTRAALGQAPTDPVINGYHLTALAQRDAMLKQIKATPATSW